MTVNTKAEKASTTLATMLDYLGLTANVKVEEKKDGKIVLVTYSDDAGRIIGKKGQSLQSLELLVNRMISKDETNSQWVSIDVDGYSSGRSVTAGSNDRKKRFDTDSDKKYSRKPEKSGRRKTGKKEYMSEDQLSQMALDAAKEVKRWGDPVTLRPMNAHDRRVIHMTLKEEAGIETKSEPVADNDKLKKVVICIKEKE